jgi:hypothetical protein
MVMVICGRSEDLIICEHIGFVFDGGLGLGLHLTLAEGDEARHAALAAVTAVII